MNQKLRHFCDGTNTMLIKFEIEMNLLLFVLWVKQERKERRSLERARALGRKIPGTPELICIVKINNQQSEPFRGFNSLEWWWSRRGENALFALAPFHWLMLSPKFCYSRIVSIDLNSRYWLFPQFRFIQANSRKVHGRQEIRVSVYLKHEIIFWLRIWWNFLPSF